MLNQLIDRLQAAWPPNRLVGAAMVVLLPFIAAGSGFLAVWVPAHFPGLPPFTAAQLTAFGVTTVGGVLFAGVTAGYKYVDGWQKHEAQKRGAAEAAAQREHEKTVAILNSPVPDIACDALEQLAAVPPAPLPSERTVPVPRPEEPPEPF